MKWTPRLMVLSVFILSIAMVAGSAMAQPGGGRGGPGGGRGGPGGGRGGPGGMMGGGMRGGGGGGAIGLLRYKVVRDEVDVNDAMAEEVRDVTQKAMESGREAFQGMGNIRDLPEEERRAKFEEMREKMQERMKDVEGQVRKVIGDDKFRRLKQIEMQMAGVEAMRRADVVEGLKLSQEQQDKISGLFDASREKMGEMFRNFREMSEEERTAAREKMGASRQELQKQVMAVPDDEQKGILKKMMGVPFAKMDELREEMRSQGRGGPGGGEGRGQRGRGERGGEGRGQRGGGEGGGQRRQRPT